MSAYRPIIDKAPFENIIIATWHDIDVGDATNVQYYFTSDARLIFGTSAPIVGRPAIHDGYQTRRAQGPRLSRHVVSNVFVTSGDDQSVQTTCCFQLYAGNGVAPLPHPEPIAVAEQLDRFVRGEDGRWLIAERRITTLFADPTTVFNRPPSPPAE